MIGGLPALGVTVIDGDTLEFTVDPAADVGDGTYTVTAGGRGGARSARGRQRWPTPARSCWTPRRRSSPAPSWNGAPLPPDRVLPEGPLTFQAVLSEALGPVGAEDVGLWNFDLGTVAARGFRRFRSG